jgi:hypothetical protein
MKHCKVFSVFLSLVLTLGITTQKVHAYGIGLASSPLESEAKLLSAELTGITSTGGGVGMQIRYTQKLDEKGTMDAGLGISGGEHSARLFAGYDFEILPDYENQPRSSIKVFVENSKEFRDRRNILGLAPTFSKGFSFWEKEAFPYISFPYAVSLNGNNNSYNTTLSANIGVSGIVPSDSGTNKQLTASAEAIFGLKDSFTGLFLGIAYPIE